MNNIHFCKLVVVGCEIIKSAQNSKFVVGNIIYCSSVVGFCYVIDYREAADQNGKKNNSTLITGVYRYNYELIKIFIYK